MEKKKMIYILIASAIALIMTIALIINPLLKPAELIRFSILRLTPIGSSMEDVIEVIESRDDWELMHVSYRWGYRRSRLSDYIVGEKSIRAFIGNYNILIPLNPVHVSVYWGFDGEGNLIGVRVRKDVGW